MRTVADEVRDMVIAGSGFLELIDHLRERSDFTLTPLNLLRVLQEALDVPMIESREMLEFFDPELRPLTDVDEVERRGDTLFTRYRNQPNLE